jgi:hypothetical protein
MTVTLSVTRPLRPQSKSQSEPIDPLHLVVGAVQAVENPRHDDDDGRGE